MDPFDLHAEWEHADDRRPNLFLLPRGSTLTRYVPPVTARHTRLHCELDSAEIERGPRFPDRIDHIGACNSAVELSLRTSVCKFQGHSTLGQVDSKTIRLLLNVGRGQSLAHTLWEKVEGAAAEYSERALTEYRIRCRRTSFRGNTRRHSMWHLSHNSGHHRRFDRWDSSRNVNWGRFRPRIAHLRRNTPLL